MKSMVQYCTASFAVSVIFLVKKGIEDQRWKKICVLMAKTYFIILWKILPKGWVPYKKKLMSETDLRLTPVPTVGWFRTVVGLSRNQVYLALPGSCMSSGSRRVA